MNKFFYALAFLFFTFGQLFAQDLHYSQFYNYSMAINPALTGRIREDFRISAIYRNQWKQANATFATTSISGDMNFISIPKFLDKMGAGLIVTNDELPNGIFKNQSAYASVAFHKSLGTFKRHRVSLGIQGGYVRKNVSKNGLYTRSDVENFQAPTGNFQSTDATVSGASSFGYGDVNGGAFWDFTVNKALELSAGISAFNLTKPNDYIYKNIAQGDASQLPRRYIGTLSASYHLSKRVTLLPAVMYMNQAYASDLNMGLAAGYHFNQKKDITALLGVWYRNSDAFIVMAGMKIKNYKVAFSYDATTSDLNDVKKATNVKDNAVIGAYEITITYVGFLKRALPNDVTIPCRFF
jgi:type IX secretion system PorP/SprF family membrane protein